MYVHRLTRAIIAGIMLGIMVALNVILVMFLAIAVAWLLLVLYSWQIPPPGSFRSGQSWVLRRWPYNSGS